MSENKIKIGITHGDINGIGYEIIIKTFLENNILDICTPVIYGSRKVTAYHRKALNIPNFIMSHIHNANEIGHKRINIIDVLDDNVRVELGKPTEISGEAAYLSLERAVADIKENKIDAIVTAPISKPGIYSDKFRFAGHTEYFKQRFNSEDVIMIMVHENLKIAVATGHVPLSKVSALITTDFLLKKIKLLHYSMRIDFGISKPKIAILGLNPHAGDNGIIGNEEKEIIIPTIEKAKELNIAAVGPYSADSFFGTYSHLKFDVILAMYHDQGLIPFKTIAFENGVNYTAGLPIIRTSPAHGTAFEIAGKNQADENSFRKAIYLACDIVKNRSLYKELSENPLQTVDKSAL